MLGVGDFFFFIIGGLTVEYSSSGVPVLVVAGIMCIGFLVLKPNESAVLTLFRALWSATVRRDGLSTGSTPFLFQAPDVAAACATFTDADPEGERQGRQSDRCRPPVVVWDHQGHRSSGFFDVDDFRGPTSGRQCENRLAPTVVVSTHPYDERPRRGSSPCAGNTIAVSDLPEERPCRTAVDLAGIEVRDMRINALGLRRRNRLDHAAPPASRSPDPKRAKRLVDGAIGMVKMALDRFQSEGRGIGRAASAPTSSPNMMMVLLSDEGCAGPSFPRPSLSGQRPPGAALPFAHRRP